MRIFGTTHRAPAPERVSGRLTEQEAGLAEEKAAAQRVREQDGQAAAAARDPSPPAGGAGDEPPTENVSETGRRDYAPVGHEPATGRLAIVKRTAKEFNENTLTDQAAALTYYGLLALFPALIALVSILGLFGDPRATTDALTGIISDLAPGPAATTFSGPIESITANDGTAGVMFVFGILAALWSASGYVGAFMRASNIIYETPEGRPFWKLRPLQLAVTLTMILLAVLLLIGLVLTGPIVDAVARPLGLSGTAVTVWDIVKWPVMAAMVVTIVAVLYYASPNVRLPGLRLIAPGAVVALAVWLVASAAFAFYVANFGSYDKTYGALGGVIALLVWLWLSNLALLFGAQLNAEVERDRELKGGVVDAARELQLDARDEPGERATT